MNQRRERSETEKPDHDWNLASIAYDGADEAWRGREADEVGREGVAAEDQENFAECLSNRAGYASGEIPEPFPSNTRARTSDQSAF